MCKTLSSVAVAFFCSYTVYSLKIFKYLNIFSGFKMSRMNIQIYSQLKKYTNIFSPEYIRYKIFEYSNIRIFVLISEPDL